MSLEQVPSHFNLIPIFIDGAFPALQILSCPYLLPRSTSFHTQVEVRVQEEEIVLSNVGLRADVIDDLLPP